MGRALMAAFGNERDVEVPALLAFLKELRPTSLLDVGAHGTAAIYAPQVRAAIGQDAQYAGADIFEAEPALETILNRFIQGDFLQFSPGGETWDVVTCVSVIEHVGVKGETLPAPRLARRQFVQTLMECATRAVLITCPYGAFGGVAGEYENITASDLRGFEALAAHFGFGVRCRFFAGDHPQNGPWSEVRPHVANMLGAPHGRFCVLVMECVR